MVFDRGQVELLGDLGRRHGALDVLLVGEDEHGGLLEVLTVQHLVELLLGDAEPLTVRAVHHQDDELPGNHI